MFNWFKKRVNNTQIIEKEVENNSVIIKKTEDEQPINDEELIKEVQEEQEEQTKKDAIKRYQFYVKGTFVDERQKFLTKLVKEMKKTDYKNFNYWDKYEGYTDREIIEELYEKVYEYSGRELPPAYLEHEDTNPYDPNAIKILVEDLNGNKFHIGYVPKELCKEIRDMESRFKPLLALTLDGGKYKKPGYDDYEDEDKIITGTDEYKVKAYLSFWENV